MNVEQQILEGFENIMEDITNLTNSFPYSEKINKLLFDTRLNCSKGKNLLEIFLESVSDQETIIYNDILETSVNFESIIIGITDSFPYSRNRNKLILDIRECMELFVETAEETISSNN
jgi:hypothetical protein